MSINKKEAYFYEGGLVRITPSFYYSYYGGSIFSINTLYPVLNREERGVYTSRKYSLGEYILRKYLAIR